MHRRVLFTQAPVTQASSGPRTPPAAKGDALSSQAGGLDACLGEGSQVPEDAVGDDVVVEDGGQQGLVGW